MGRARKSIVYKEPNSPFWYFRFKIKGAPLLKRSSETDHKETAEAIALKARQDLIDSVRLKLPARKVQWTIDQACGRYWLDYARHLAEAEDNAKPQLNNILRILGNDTPCAEIDAAAMQRLINGLRATTWAEIRGIDAKAKPKSRMHTKYLTPAYINRVLNTCCKMLHHVAATYNVNAPDHVASKLHLQESAGHEVFLTPDDGATFTDKIVKHAQPIVELAFMTGLRKGNLIGKPPKGLRCEQITFDAKPRMTFRTKTRSKKTKQKIHTVPLIAEAVAMLRALGADRRRGPVFLFGQNGCDCQWCKDHAGEPIQGIKRAFKTAAKAIGRAELRFHDTRHSAASAVLLKTGNMKLAQTLLGHSSIDVTNRYAHLLNADAVEAVGNSLSGFARRNPERSAAIPAENKAEIEPTTKRRKRA